MNCWYTEAQMWSTTEKLPCFSPPSPTSGLQDFKHRILITSQVLNHTKHPVVSLFVRQQRWWTRNCCIYALFRLPKWSAPMNHPTTDPCLKITIRGYFHPWFANNSKWQNGTLQTFPNSGRLLLSVSISSSAWLQLNATTNIISTCFDCFEDKEIKDKREGAKWIKVASASASAAHDFNWMQQASSATKRRINATMLWWLGGQ